MKVRPFIVPSLFVSGALLVLSGACSQHQPGSYEGGGRTIGSVVIEPVGGSSSPPDGGGPVDNFVPPDVQPDISFFDQFGGGG